MDTNLAYQEAPQEELIDGRIIAMSPAATNHNHIAGNIFWLFRTYLNRKKCVPFTDGTAVYLTDTDRFIPDMMVVCDRSKIKGNGIHGAPDLVVEVLSPSTGKYDRGRKMEVYAQCGVREYWIVSPGDKTIEQYLPKNGKLILNTVYAAHPDYMLDVMTEKEKSEVITEFKCSLFDDFIISLDDIFSGLE